MPNPAIPDSRRLVLGAAVGLTIAQTRVFVRSLRATGYAGDVMLLVAPWQWPLMAWLARHRVTTRPLVSTRKLNGPIHAFRFEKFATYLRTHAARYDEAMIADVRDVAFQAHPFPGDLVHDDLEGGCRFYLEGAGTTIGEEPTNLRWMRTFLAPEDVAALAPCRVSCCGVTIGTAAAMADYLARLAAYLHGLPLKLRREGGADTAFHNLMVHVTREARGRVVENDVHVATMGLESPAHYAVTPAGLVTAPDGRAPAILHQYDRLPAIRTAVTARFSG